MMKHVLGLFGLIPNSLDCFAKIKNKTIQQPCLIIKNVPFLSDPKKVAWTVYIPIPFFSGWQFIVNSIVSPGKTGHLMKKSTISPTLQLIVKNKESFSLPYRNNHLYLHPEVRMEEVHPRKRTCPLKSPF